MAGPIAALMEPGEDVQLRPIATFRNVVSGQEYQAGAYLTDRAFYVVDEQTKQPISRTSIADLSRAEMVNGWVSLTFRPDGEGLIGAIFKITPRRTAEMFVASLIASRKTMDVTAES